MPTMKNIAQSRRIRKVVVAVKLSDASWRDFLTGFFDYAKRNTHWDIRVVQSVEELERTMSGCQGIVTGLKPSPRIISASSRNIVPIVAVGAEWKFNHKAEAITYIRNDNEDIGQFCAQHFQNLGKFASAGFVPSNIDDDWSAARERGFLGGFHDVEKSTFRNVAEPGSDKDIAALVDWLKSLPKPAAVMAASDMCAADVINACRAENIRVPSQVSIIGVDHDISQHAKCGMSISSVILNLRMMGRQAVKELDFLFRHPKWKGRPHEVLIPTKDVFAGESTAQSVSGTRLVNIALAFISANCTKDLTPNDVIAHLGCSRRLAELRFSQVSGSTIHKAINNARLNEVQRRIRHGESVSSIVKAMHFNSANQLYLMYNRHFGHITR